MGTITAPAPVAFAAPQELFTYAAAPQEVFVQPTITEANIVAPVVTETITEIVAPAPVAFAAPQELFTYAAAPQEVFVQPTITETMGDALVTETIQTYASPIISDVVATAVTATPVKAVRATQQNLLQAEFRDRVKKAMADGQTSVMISTEDAMKMLEVTDASNSALVIKKSGKKSGCC